MSAEWRQIKLEDALSYVQPTKFIVKSTAYDDSYQTPVLTPGKSFLLGFTDETDGIYQNIPTIIFDDFTTEFKSVDFPFKVKSSAMKMLELKSDDYDMKFLYYLMLTLRFNASEHKRYWISKYSKQNVSVPPLAEQKQIAAILDAADSIRQKDQQLVEHYTALSQSLFLEMFGNPITNSKGFKIGTIRELISSAKYGTSSKAQDNGAYPYLRMNNITYDGYMDFKSLKYINLDEKEKEKYIVKKGDVLFNRTNSKELVGKTGIFNEDTEMAIAGYLIRLRVNEYANPYFIWGYLNSQHGKLTLKHMCKNIVGMANINAQELQNIKILCPPLILQNQFAERIAIIEQQKQQAQANQQKSEALFNSLLQLAFTGELTADKAA